jgi:hypothetical protein
MALVARPRRFRYGLQLGAGPEARTNLTFRGRRRTRNGHGSQLAVRVWLGVGVAGVVSMGDVGHDLVVLHDEVVGLNWSSGRDAWVGPAVTVPTYGHRVSASLEARRPR